MKAEILSTGNEVLSGSIVDTNAAYIAERLEENGIEVTRQNTCGDRLEDIVLVLNEIASRADIAVVTGGLGPTTDDLSAEAASIAAGVPLILDPQSLADIEARFTRLGRKMSPSNEKQAYFPQGATVLKNPVGTAPGFSLKIARCVFYFAPGVPFEMEKMLQERILPSVLERSDRMYSMVRSITVFGMGESLVGEKVSPLVSSFPDIRLGLRAAFPLVYVKLYIRGDNEDRMKHALEEAATAVVEALGDVVVSPLGETLEETVGRLLVARGETLSVAESCTGGRIADMITAVAGSSRYFLFSGVTYSNQAKMAVLGVRAETLERWGAVSEETVREMATGARAASNADWGIATSGIAGPDGGSEEKPVGTVCIGLCGPHGISSRRLLSTVGVFSPGKGSRERNRTWFAYAALDMLRKALSGIE